MRDRERAERCFALARSTTFPAERATAIERGKAIAEAAGLDLASFDIPGEARRPRPSRFAEDLFSKPRSPFYAGTWTREDLDEVLEQFRATMDAAERLSRANDLNRVRREAEARKLARLNAALNHLWQRGWRVYPEDGVGLAATFTAPDHEGTYSAEDVLSLARRHGFAQ